MSGASRNDGAVLRPVRLPFALPFRLARRELRGGLRGFRIFLACLILGVAAIASVQSVSDGVMQGLRANGRAVLGGDLAVRMLYDPLSEGQLAYFNALGKVLTTAEVRAMGRRPDNAMTSVVELKAVGHEYPLFGDVRLVDGDGKPLDTPLQELLKPGADGMPGAVLQRLALDRLDLKVGDTIGLGEQDFKIRAVLDREPDLAGSASIILGPRMMISLDALQSTGLVRTGSMIYWHYKIDLAGNPDPAAVKDRINADWPDNGWRIRDFNNAAPRVERFISRLTQFLTLVGLTSLLVGGVGVGNAVNAFVTEKLRTIATLKCLGAPGRLVFRTYLLQIMALTLLGVAVGVGIGAAVPYVLDRPLNALLPVSFTPFFRPGGLAVSALFGVLTALTFSLWPIGRARETAAVDLFRDLIAPRASRPRAIYIAATAVCTAALVGLALGNADDLWFSGWFVAGALAVLLVFRLIGAAVVAGARLVRNIRRPALRLAVSNMHRPGNPTGNVILSLGLGLTVLVAIAMIEGNFSRALLEDIPEDAPAFFFIDIQPDELDDFKAVITAVPGAHHLVVTPMARGSLEKVNGIPAKQALKDPGHSWVMRGDRGLTYTAEMPENSMITQGRWWPADYHGKPLLSIAEDVAKAFDIGVGDSITVNLLGVDITAEIANVRQIDWGMMTMNFALTFSPGTFDGAPMTYLATINADDYPAEAAIQKAVAQKFPQVTAVHIRDALQTVNDILGSIAMAVRVIAAVALAAGTLVLAGAIAAGHRRRVYDSVILKVLGATRRDIMLSYALEYGALGGITALIAGVLGCITAWAVLTWVMEVPWAVLWLEMALTVGLSIIITLGLGFAGTWRALGQKAAPLLRNE